MHGLHNRVGRDANFLKVPYRRRGVTPIELSVEGEFDQRFARVNDVCGGVGNIITGSRGHGGRRRSARAWVDYIMVERDRGQSTIQCTFLAPRQ
jgi:hypothetical protein